MATKIIFAPKWLSNLSVAIGKCESIAVGELSSSDKTILVKSQLAMRLALSRLGIGEYDLETFEYPVLQALEGKEGFSITDRDSVLQCVSDAIGIHTFSKLPRSTDYVLYLAERISFKDEGDVIKVSFNPEGKRAQEDILLDYLEISGARVSTDKLFSLKAAKSYFKKICAVNA